MQLTAIFCYALLSITISSVCARNYQNNDIQDIKSDRKLRRRESTVFIDTLPTERIHHKPKVIFRRISKQRYMHPKPHYGPPRTLYGLKTTRRPAKKSKLGPKYTLNKQKSQKPRFRVPPKRTPKPIYGAHKKKKLKYPIYKPVEPINFAEPPKYDNINNYEQALDLHNFLKPTFTSSESNNRGYGEPPVDSYGAPIQPNLHDLASSTMQTYSPIGEESQSYDIWSHSFVKNQKSYSSKKKPTYTTKPVEIDTNIFVTPVPENDPEEQDFNSYSDIYNYRLSKDKRKAKPNNYLNHVKMMNKPWKINKYSSKIVDNYNYDNDDIIVGGLYAEPPARPVPKHHPAVHAYLDDEFEEPDALSSATSSPYINYKNSNVAFSPQNLNDAFGIID